MSLLQYSQSSDIRKLAELADEEVGWEVAEQLLWMFKQDSLDVEEFDVSIRKEKITEPALRDIYDFCQDVRRRGLDTDDDDCLDIMLFLEEWVETAQDVNPDIKKHLSPVWRSYKLPDALKSADESEQKVIESA